MAVTLRTYGALGVLQGAAFSWWADRVMVWFEATGRDWTDNRLFMPAIISPVPLAAVPCYLAMRLFEHPGEWAVIFTDFSLPVMGYAIVLCAIVATYSASMRWITTHAGRGTHPFIRGAKAPPLWKIVLILLAVPGFPLLCFLIALV